MQTLDLYLLPKHVARERLVDATVIVVDLLRASTTICTALAADAECVIPFAEIDETLAAAQAFGRENVLLGGERHGKLIPGFDLGNSPAEYTAERVAGRRILFTTTNGARALEHARDACRVVVGAAVNRSAVVQAVAPDADVVVLCAGTDGEIAREDQLAGGALVQALFANGVDWKLGPEALAALDAWGRLVQDANKTGRPLVEHFTRELRTTQGGLNLIDIGQDADLASCTKLDALSVVPQLDAAAHELRRGVAAGETNS